MGGPAAAPGTRTVNRETHGRLAGRVVVVTRDGEDDDPLAALLEARGATVRAWPTLAFEPPRDPAPLARALEDPDGWDWIVFTSARAVPPVSTRAAVAPSNGRPRVAAVGEATARALAEAGWSVDFVGEGPGAAALAGGLRAATDLAGARILVPAASRARDTLADALSRAGATVHQVEAYRTLVRGPDPARVEDDLRRGVDAITFASPSSVEALATTLDVGQVASIALVAIGPTTAEALTRWGARDFTLADDASFEGLALAVERILTTPDTPRTMDTSTSESLFQRARSVMPGGVNSPVRAFKGVGGTPRFMREAKGAHLTDVDGNRYLDFVGSWGVHLLGHDPDPVRESLQRALARGTSFGTPSEGEVVLAELLVERVPGLEMVRLVNSGTEATMSAVRLARAATGRHPLIKFRGGYHGHGDAFLVEAGSGAATLGVPSSPGVPAATVADTLVAEYNDLGSVGECFARVGGDVAAVIVEPVAGNMGCVPPVEGFLPGLRALCDTHGALLVFDEVMTGFRVGPHCAQGRYGVRPDLTTLGKVIGGGLPVGAYGGREDLMRQVAPDGPVYQAGTLSGNPLAVAAGIAVFRYLDEHPEVFGYLEELGAQLDRGFAALADRSGTPLQWNRVGAMGSLFFSERPVRDWPSASASSRERFAALFHGLLERGIHLPPSPFEAWFWSAAHTDDDMARTLEAVGAVLETSP
jgi:glutamate-1-semialdehyde 2,1-aminomutase